MKTELINNFLILETCEQKRFIDLSKINTVVSFKEDGKTVVKISFDYNDNSIKITPGSTDELEEIFERIKEYALNNKHIIQNSKI